MKPRKIYGLSYILAVLLVAACQKPPEPKTESSASGNERAATSSSDSGNPSQNRPVEPSK